MPQAKWFSNFAIPNDAVRALATAFDFQQNSSHMLKYITSDIQKLCSIITIKMKRMVKIQCQQMPTFQFQ